MQPAVEFLHRRSETAGPARLPRRLVQHVARATSSLSLLSRVIAGCALLAVLVGGAFAVMLVSMSTLRSSTREQTHLKDVMAATLELEKVVNDLEAGLRSYVLTGNDRFLDTWREARSQLPVSISDVAGLTAARPSQHQQVVQLSTMIDGYITEYGLPLILITHVSPDAARAPDATNEGLLRIKAIRHRLELLLATENRLASRDAARAQNGASEAVRIGIAALVATAGLLLLFVIFLARGIARPVRTVADGASRVAAGDLSTRLDETGPAEIHVLTRSFNGMARSLDQGKRELEAQNEELRHSQRQMSQLVSIVSHELRTPLSSILGYTRVLLNREVAKDDRQHYLEIIEEQGRRLSSLVDQFLEGEGVEAGRLELDDEPLDLRPVLLEEAELIAAESAKHRIRVSVAPAALPVRGDRDRLAQVVVNLITNAVKYSPDGGVVEVSGEVEPQVVRVLVRDQGIGVPEEHQTRIFTKFFRGDARESGITGTGLGLAVSREIVEAHDGRIGFTSTPGAGSTFWFELPRSDREREAR